MKPAQGSEVIVVDTSTANIASMLAALRRAGVRPVVSADTAKIVSAERVVLPGVGSFGAGMQGLRNANLVEAIIDRIDRQKSLLAVCLGLQLLCNESEESAEIAGLGLFDQTVTRFGSNLRVPQLGWNRVRPSKNCDLLRDGYAYYANSYRLTSVPQGWSGAYSEYGEPFVAAIERGPLLACQFHPELSGAWGQALIERWLCSNTEVSSC